MKLKELLKVINYDVKFGVIDSNGPVYIFTCYKDLFPYLNKKVKNIMLDDEEDEELFIITV